MISSSHTLVELRKAVDWNKVTAILGKSFCPEKGMPTITMQLMIALNTSNKS